MEGVSLHLSIHQTHVLLQQNGAGLKQRDVISPYVMPRRGRRGINQGTGHEPSFYCTHFRIWQIMSSDCLSLAQELTGLSLL